MSRICERCGDYTATQMVSGEDLCVDCANRQSKLNAAERKASSHGIDYSELALGVEERDAELSRLRADLAEAHADVQRFEAALDVSQRALAQARATISVRNALHDELIDNLQNMAAAVRDAEAERDDADDDLAKALALIDKKDTTIRALVVAARVMAHEGEMMIGWRQFASAVRETIAAAKAERTQTTHD